jgi:uncharacterized protein (TIGR02145 family)
MFIFLHFFVNESQAQIYDIDKKSYPIVKIGGQTWMATDLTVSHFRNGDNIPLALTLEEFEKFGAEKIPARMIEFGQTKYNWFAVSDPRGLAPTGWHVPSKTEWDVLISLVGDLTELKGSSGWLENENGENRFGFNAKPNDEAGTCGFWWTSTEIEMTDPENPKVYAHNIEMYGNAQMDCFVSNPFKEYGFNVRCIKDQTK